MSATFKGETFNASTIEQILKTTQARAEAAEAEVTRLKGEMVTLTTQNTAWLDKYGDCQNQMYAAIERAEKAEAERDRLKTALEIIKTTRPHERTLDDLKEIARKALEVK